MHQVALDDLTKEEKPDNASVVGSIFFDYLDYKGRFVFGGCETWTDFHTKAVALPRDNFYPSYVKARFGIENYNTGEASSSTMEADFAGQSNAVSQFGAGKIGISNLPQIPKPKI